ncbi:hypothetical protein JMM61_13000 [Rhodovulum sulfidophilum]|uniref:hypothetical protein n=1 Tax=Rhodovulum sulfidophilum TaxID=35806 RepID=UPI0019273B76|nr:hypothetical protein [Rhodovulum sulfidophilum]MBL3586297.1 hypothetical protein [Rhodovulum sulfidophilum]
MDRAVLDTLLDRALLDLLSDRIVARLKARERSALLLVSGTDLGLDAAIRSLSPLNAAGWSFEIRRSPDAAGLLTPERLRLLGGARAIPPMAAPGETDIDGVLARHGLVVVPALSAALAARASLGMAEDEVSALLTGALERGCRVVAARDGLCPASRERKARGLTGNEAYREMLTGHLLRLQSYGVELAWAAKLGDAIASPRPGDRGPGPGRGTATPPVPGSRVFGWSQAKTFDSAELKLDADVLITPLAAEELRARHVRVVRA